MSRSRVVVLLATYNGARHLGEQLATLERQTIDRIDVLASDDGSTDATRDVLAIAAKQWRKGRFDIVDGPCSGFSENFRSLILRAGANADYFAFCDQDDLWDDDKLEAAIASLASLPVSGPALYCSATRTVTEEGQPAGKSPIMRRPPSFRNALVQSIAGGNTMVMNRAAMLLMQAASTDVRFVSHDWWAYLVVSGAGGTVVYDPVPRISYRQHDRNLVGANAGALARFRRLQLLTSGRWFVWIGMNIGALQASRDLLTEEGRQLLDEFSALRRLSGPLRRLRRFHKLRLYRQTIPGALSMAVAVFLGKL
jgi:glycosyltransferase involved in cell wall biosynthesis